MIVFIVRPFGKKATENGDEIDFDHVEQDLIKPVLDKLGLAGGTTELIVRAGNIRADMFQELLTADLVIADISINNANVYYELGIRHALRDRPTILIRCRADVVPFDLKTDRYLTYDRLKPGDTQAALKQMIEATLVSDVPDSPVYQLLPNLKPSDPSAYIVVPLEFIEAVGQAKAAGDVALLGLLGEEAHDMRWGVSGLRLVGGAEYELGAFDCARVTWEAVLRLSASDREANLTLGTIYQRLNDLISSTQALDRALASKNLTQHERAEALALQGRNTKTAWEAGWRVKPAENRAREALRSSLLIESFKKYNAGFNEDRNHYYSGLNALAMLTVLTELAKQHPDTWRSRADDPDDADQELRRFERMRVDLQGAVKLALQSRGLKMARAGDADVWLDLSIADHRLLTTNRPDFVRSGYADARNQLAERLKDPAAATSQFPAGAAARQICMYLDLGVLVDNANAALDELGIECATLASGESEPRTRHRIVVATGHRLDAEDRTEPRFPRDPECTAAARQAILEKLTEERDLGNGRILGISGAASGSDLLFHEACDELGIASVVNLAIPHEAYVRESVQDAGPAWVERFRAVCSSREVYIVNKSDELPPWVRDKPDYGVFQRGNIWMMEYAFAQPEADVTLLALWNGMAGDGPGGTTDMVRLARDRGAKVVIIDSNQLFGLDAKDREP
jgi:hypothetical protein